VGERMIMDMNKYVTLQLVDYLGEYLIEPTGKKGILIATLITKNV
jgi:hypothetical protein